MIEDSREWLKALLDSGIVNWGGAWDRDQICKECGKPLLIGNTGSKYHAQCGYELARRQLRLTRNGQTAEYKRGGHGRRCRKCDNIVPVKAYYCADCRPIAARERARLWAQQNQNRASA